MTNILENNIELMKEIESLGIKVDPNPNSNMKINLEKDNFQKVALEYFAMFDSIMKTIPTILSNEATKDTYKVIFDKGLGTLQRASSKHPGLYRANVVEFGSNNAIKGQALLKPLDKSFQLVSSTFAIMSVITGQYYLNNINRELKDVNKKLDGIKSFLVNDKKSTLLSEGEFLKNVQESLEFILNDDIYRSSTLTNIQNITISSLAKVTFYSSQIEQLKFDEKKAKIEEIFQDIYELESLIANYLYSTQVFSLAIFLETILSKNTDEKYLEYMEKRIEEVKIKYKNNLQNWVKNWKNSLNKTKAFSESAILKFKKNMDKYQVGLPLVLFPLSSSMIGYCGISYLEYKMSEFLYERDKNKKQLKQNEAIEKIEEIIYGSLDYINNKERNIELYNAICNKKIEVLKYNGEMYIKVENPYEKLELVR